MTIRELLILLHDSGLSDAEIGRLSCPENAIRQPTINRLRHGVHKSCSDEKGQLIRALAVKIGIIGDYK